MSEKILLQILAEVKDLRTDVNDIKADITGIKSEITSMKTDITGIKSEITSMKTDITGIKSEITSMKTDITGIKSEITVMKADITSMKAQLDKNTQIIKVIRDRQEETDAKLENLTMDVHHMRGELTALTETVASIQDELAFTTHKAYTNEKELFNLRRHNLDSKIS
ncbi:hypothetical protein [Sporosarcina sp. FSL K6-3457]|uniref:hypothetical protein n=1 Tax=Sporosarcina sp. FSL K6-3457 TaxID=2978204 RepID=UPI0030FCD0C0